MLLPIIDERCPLFVDTFLILGASLLRPIKTRYISLGLNTTRTYLHKLDYLLFKPKHHMTETGSQQVNHLPMDLFPHSPPPQHNHQLRASGARVSL